MCKEILDDIFQCNGASGQLTCRLCRLWNRPKQ